MDLFCLCVRVPFFSRFSRIWFFVPRNDGNQNQYPVAFISVRTVILFAAAPVAGMLTFYLTEKSFNDLTFAESNVGGVALGVDTTSDPISVQRISENCVKAPITLERGDIALADFLICERSSMLSLTSTAGASIQAEVTSDHAFRIEICIGEAGFAFESFGLIVGQRKRDSGRRMVLRVATKASHSSLAHLVDPVIQSILEWCQTKEDAMITQLPFTTNPRMQRKRSPQTHKIRKTLPCSREFSRGDQAWFTSLQEKFKARIAFVYADNLVVAQETSDHLGIDLGSTASRDTIVFASELRQKARIVCITMAFSSAIIFLSRKFLR